MHIDRPVAVLIHTSDPDAARAWYQAVFPDAILSSTPTSEFQFLVLGELQLEFVPSDEKVKAGPCGTVIYWAVEDFDESLRSFQSRGATLYRGPLDIEYGQRMCQVQDPWGNCIGLRGR
jgi:predicted enzyme related to lactoylglutathione lyase